MNVRVGIVDGRWTVVVVMLVLMCKNTACKRSSPSDLRDSQSADVHTTTSDRPAGAGQQLNEQQIGALIEKLAISQEPAEFRPVYTPSKDTPRSDPRVIAFEAAERLRECGKDAFPGLLAHLEDDRQSVAFVCRLPADVGLACFTIIEGMVYGLPGDYRGSLHREGADGQLHERVLFAKPAMFDPNSAEAWLDAREDKSLTEIQVEALEWLIEQEKQIGFPTEEDRELYLYPLERQRDRLSSQLRNAKPD
jgi:hypothetical protein